MGKSMFEVRACFSDIVFVCCFILFYGGNKGVS